MFQDKSSRLYTGDFYITRHSNLSEVHTVFHLVTDDSTRSEISSRHPVILSLRSIIKLCFKYDIMTLTIPLLLTHEMSEVGQMFYNYDLFSNKLLRNCDDPGIIIL